MNGDERARFCGQCQKNVYNLSAMTRAQIETLIREKEGKFCGRFYRRADGGLLTADCPSQVRRMRKRLAGIGGALCALLFSLAAPRQANSNGGGETGQILMGDVAVSPLVCTTNQPPEIMGRIALPQPAVTNCPAPNQEKVVMGLVALPVQTNRTSPPVTPK